MMFLQDFCRYWPRVLGEELKTGPYIIKLNTARVVCDSLAEFNMVVHSKVSSIVAPEVHVCLFQA